MDSAPSSARELQPVTPSLFILPSWEEDAVDMFHWRLTDKDGPEYCEFDASRDSPNWVGKRLTWPTTSTPDTFQRAFITANLPYVRTALRTARQRRRPVCFRTLVAVSEIERDFRRFVDAWIGSWPPILQQAAETPRGESQQSTAPPPIVGLLVFQYRSSTSRGWSFWKRRDVRIDRLCDLLKDVDRSAAVEVTVLPPLTTVTFQNAGEWLESPDVLGHNLDRRVRGAIQQMFQNRRAGVPMEEFASTINAAQEYRERGHAQ
jgi:hypothetical protein